MACGVFRVLAWSWVIAAALYFLAAVAMVLRDLITRRRWDREFDDFLAALRRGGEADD